MNKLITKIITAFLIIFALIAMVFLILNAVSFRKNIDIECDMIQTEGDSSFGAYVWECSHATGSNEKLTVYVSQNISKLSEDIYKVDLLINQTENKKYSVNNIHLSYNLNENDTIISDFYGTGGGEYKEGEISFDDGIKIKCTSNNNYMDCNFIIKSDSAEFFYYFNAFDLSYDISDNFPYLANKFYNITPFENI